MIVFGSIFFGRAIWSFAVVIKKNRVNNHLSTLANEDSPKFYLATLIWFLIVEIIPNLVMVCSFTYNMLQENQQKKSRFSIPLISENEKINSKSKSSSSKKKEIYDGFDEPDLFVI
ncbi:hypothetical protein M0811_14726 [Anaeramoeba ignava]|uniref:Uncharacterized protein n=1 Tax=Anaeramoeba ignava TaxID=1746090 RepID=A0A9Q0LVQ6_ANAIG|nr:hypothetical protein M0811_14726 [Anaeramoeba ignava]